MRFAPGGAIRLKRTKKTDAQKKTKNGIKINMIDQICISTKKVKIKKQTKNTALLKIGFSDKIEIVYIKISINNEIN